jgi:hypothetical protein
MEDEDDLMTSERFFIHTMLATSEYENFYLLMRAEMQSIARARVTQKADSAAGHK